MNAHRARFAVVIVAAGVVAAVPWAAPASASPPHALTWLAAGDSYSSGTGLPHADGACKRADPSTGDEVYSQVAAAALGPSIIAGGTPNLVACSGALTTWFFNSIGGRQPEWTHGTYDLVTFTFGGDDIGFAPTLAQCVGVNRLIDTVGTFALASRKTSRTADSDPGHKCPKESDERATIASVMGGDTYRDFLAAIAAKVVSPGGNIVVLGYPELVEDPDRWSGLSSTVPYCYGINKADAREIRGLGGDLNATIGTAVKRVDALKINGVHLSFLDVNSGGGLGIASGDSRLFEPSTGTRHNACSADSWINGLAKNGSSFHPTQRAHDAEGSLLADIIPRLDWSTLAAQPVASPMPTTPVTTAPQPPAPYHGGKAVTVDTHATGGDAGHKGPGDQYAAGPTYPAGTTVHIYCYVNGESITNSHYNDTTTVWDLSDDGYFYTDAWLYTGSNSPVVPACGQANPTVDTYATGGDAGHKGPGDQYAAGPTHAAGTTIPIYCYVNGESITNSHYNDTTTVWDLSSDGYWYTDAWLYTGSNNPVVPACG